MSEDKLQKRAGKAIILHPPTMLALILRLKAGERARRSTPDKEFDEWHIPGGSLEPGDKGSTEAAARREVLEETGLAVRVLGKLGTAEWDAFYEGEPAHFLANFYLCATSDDSSETPSVNLSSESAEFTWVSASELEAYQARGLTLEADKFIRLGIKRLEEIAGG